MLVDEENYINKYDFKVLFVCGVWDLGEVLWRILEGVVMIRIKGEVGIGNFYVMFIGIFSVG